MTKRTQRMKDAVENFLHGTLDHIEDLQAHMRERRAAQRDEDWDAGYEAAADAFLALLTESIDKLRSKSSNLSKDGQDALLSLYELRRAAEAELAAVRDPRRSRRRQDPQDTPGALVTGQRVA